MLRLLDDEEMYALVADETEGCGTGTPEAWVATNVRMLSEQRGIVAILDMALFPSILLIIKNNYYK